MKTTYLFSHRLKAVSGIVFLLSFSVFALFIALDLFEQYELKVKVFAFMDNALFKETTYFGFTENSITDEILMLITIASGIVYAFSKEKNEDEMVAALRLQSLAWATIANYSIMLLCYLFIYGLSFLSVLMAVMFSQLLIFIILFRYKMYRFYKSSHEE